MATATAPTAHPRVHVDTRSASRIKELMMATKSLYVGNLPYDITEQDLRNLFEAWGPVAETRLISSRGFGFVEVPAEKAADAITAMNGKEFKGRALVVNEARPRTERPSYRDSGGGAGRDRPAGGGPPRGGRGGAGGGGRRRDRGGGDRGGGARW
jgi:RNA recognition motif-containing protein